MQRDSIQRRLIASVLLSQSILTVGLMVIGVIVTYWRLLSTLDIAMQAHATSVAVLVRYTDDGSGHTGGVGLHGDIKCGEQTPVGDNHTDEPSGRR